MGKLATVVVLTTKPPSSISGGSSLRSQDGKPLATFVGDNVSYFATDIPKSTGISIENAFKLIKANRNGLF
ncbi:hypothetical protein N496_19610 (plasmid) [Clostridium botulinum A2B3 87]|uniref:DUF5052 family protein n=1 Tax=Clostridium botulinum TaxID=1491 RepID=UPI0004A578AA|nr:hypothetical protein N496_19610 [Clostridium botulinum A2B3 87]